MTRYFTQGSRTRWFIAFVVGSALWFAGQDSTAQELEIPKPHQGYFVSVGAYGAASLARQHEGNRSMSLFGPGGDVRFGQAVFDRLDLGLGLGAHAAFDSEYRAVLGHLSVEMQLRPWAGLFIRLGVGFGLADVSRTKSGLEKVDGRIGGAYTAALGYGFFPAYNGGSGGLEISPILGLQAGPGSLLSTYELFGGIEISFWTGLSKDQLELPMESAFD